MDADIYQQGARRSANSSLTKNEALANWALGLAGEAGEVADLFKKVIFHKHDLDLDKVKKELGDVAWYLAVLSDEVGLSLSDVMETNLAKLKARYPDKFSTELSRNRVE